MCTVKSWQFFLDKKPCTKLVLSSSFHCQFESRIDTHILLLFVKKKIDNNEQESLASKIALLSFGKENESLQNSHKSSTNSSSFLTAKPNRTVWFISFYFWHRLCMFTHFICGKNLKCSSIIQSFSLAHYSESRSPRNDYKNTSEIFGISTFQGNWFHLQTKNLCYINDEQFVKFFKNQVVL